MKKWPKTLVFWKQNNECLPNFEVFNKNEFLKTSNDLDDREMSLFIEENRNVNRTKKTNTDLHVWRRCASPLKKQRPLKKFPPRNLTISYLISLTTSGNLTHCVFNNCTIVFAQQSPPLPLPKRRRVVIDSDEDD